MARLKLYDALIIGLSVAAVSLVLPAVHSLDCASTRSFKNGMSFANCNPLAQLDSVLHWSYDAGRSSLSIAFVADPPSPSGWIAWALNPIGTGMVGAESLLAFKAADGSMAVRPFRLKAYDEIVPENLTLPVSGLVAEVVSGGVMSLWATVQLPPAMTSQVNHVWQVGPTVSGGFPARHRLEAANLNAKGTLDLRSARAVGGSVGDSRISKKNTHGILNAVSWGILFPVGVIVARYIRVFPSADPAWFYLHVSCQLAAYFIGVAGWGTGLKLGSESKGMQYTLHRNLGITLFCLATVQMFALFLRPKKDHKYRIYWNIYHHSIGYAVVVLGIINVFKGLGILDPAKKWKSAYIVVIAVLGLIAVLLEAITWVVALRRKSSKTPKYDGSINGEERQ